MTNVYLVPITPARWFSRPLVCLLAALLSLPLAMRGSDGLPELVKAYREKPAEGDRAALVAYARTHAKEPNGALALFALGVVAAQQKDGKAALGYLSQAEPGLPALADYVAFYQAMAVSAAGDTSQVAKRLNGLQSFRSPLSPLTAKAALLDAKAFAQSPPQNRDSVIQLLRDNYDNLPQPDTDVALATAYEAKGDLAKAVGYYQKVYFGYPATQSAADAAIALEKFRSTLGAAYPAAKPHEMLERGDRWLAAKEYTKARQEFENLISQLTGLEREQAQVRWGAARFLAGDASGAYAYLRDLHLPDGAADAERLYYMEECARHLNHDDNMDEAIKQLGRHHSESVWRLKALISGANRYLVSNQKAKYEPLYKAAYETFAPDNSTAYCHWKVTWDAYIGHQKDTVALLREQVVKYPFDAKAATALYFLARNAENEHHPSEARALYNKIVDTYPHYYYAVLARERLTQGDLAGAAPDPKTSEWLSSLEFPVHERLAIEEPTAATKARLERVRLLIAGGFPEWAESEVRFAAKVDGQPHLLAMEIARLSPSTFQSLRRMKSLSGDYLALAFESAPKRFWQLLFPLPWQRELIESAKRADLDPFLVAALIRQESEFNAGALSHANAYGLTQIVPATGRALARQQGIRTFNTNLLFNPGINLRLGAVYIRTLLDQWNGKWEETLASYNAGKSRVIEWKTWHNYQEPAEFVESIPFTETREYVQAVLRNAAIYKEIYAENLPTAEREEPVLIPKAALAPARKAKLIKARLVKTSSRKVAARSRNAKRRSHRR